MKGKVEREERRGEMVEEGEMVEKGEWFKKVAEGLGVEE